MCEFVESVLSGIVGNIIFTLFLIWVIQELRYWFYLKRKFHNREFEVFWKEFPDQVVQNITCTVHGHTIKFRGQRIKQEDSFEGEFLINPINLKMGEGFHNHTEHPDAFGFSKIIIKDSSFYVEMPYTGVLKNKSQNNEGRRIYQAFVWRIKE